MVRFSRSASFPRAKVFLNFSISTGRFLNVHDGRELPSLSDLRSPEDAATVAPMRKVLLALLVLASSVFIALPAAMGAGETTGIRGVVLDATCYGPCRYPPQPLSPYTGPGLTVAVRSLPDSQLVAKLHPTHGYFAVKLAPGWYRLKARVGPEPSCWRGEAKKVEVPSGELVRVRLRVANACVV